MPLSCSVFLRASLHRHISCFLEPLASLAAQGRAGGRVERTNPRGQVLGCDLLLQSMLRSFAAAADLMKSWCSRSQNRGVS
eukprot:6208102-Pleurochrysis_carterae.AAC.2